VETPNLNELTKGRKELSTLRQLLRATQKQIDDSVEQGNNALLDLQQEYDELAERKRELLREIEQLTNKRDEIKSKMSAAENIYGQYLEAIRAGKGKQ
jgi:uncharacterized coiled-coil DUF342 family protein